MKRRDFFKLLPAFAAGTALAIKSKPAKSSITLIKYDNHKPYDSLHRKRGWHHANPAPRQ